MTSAQQERTTPWPRIRWGLSLALACLLALAGGWLLLSDSAPVVLTWETASEVGTAGFNIYRSPIDEQTMVKVNETLIPAQGDEMVGASYRFEDTGVTPGKRYRYQIEEVEWDSKTTIYPETVEVRAGLPVLWIRIEGGLLLLVALVLLWQALLRR